MAITLQQAKDLKYGDMLHHTIHKNADGTPERWRVNGIPKVWKTRPGEVRVPVKHGIMSYGYITEDELNLVDIA